MSARSFPVVEISGWTQKTRMNRRVYLRRRMTRQQKAKTAARWSR